MFVSLVDKYEIWRIMASGKESRDPRSTSTQTTKRSSRPEEKRSSTTRYPTSTEISGNRPGCNCFVKKRYENSTAVPTAVDTKTKKTCARCYARKVTVPPSYDQPEFYAGSTVQFYERYIKPESRDSLASPSSRFDVPIDAKQSRVEVSKSADRLAPREVMNTWIPGRPKRGLFAPNENYVDVSSRDFSMRKYFPELFLSDAEKAEIRAKEGKEAVGRSCSPEDHRNSESDQEWKTILESIAVPSPRLWSDEEIALARERDEVTEEELIPRPKTPPNRPSKWFRWSCGNSKRKKKRDREKQRDEDEES